MKFVRVLMSAALAVAVFAVGTSPANAAPGAAVPTAESRSAHTTARLQAQFYGCSADQQNVVNTAVSEATNYIGNAYQHAVDPPSDSTGERYATWFGGDEPQQHAYVDTVFNNLFNNDLTTFTYDCSTCLIPNLFAYVYPDQFGSIYLCPLFWEAPTTGTDSQAGTLVGETSKFLVNGGTHGHERGQEACMELARTNSINAITNADSYKYFAENNPRLN